MASGRLDPAPGVIGAGRRPRIGGLAVVAAILGVGGFALGPHRALVLLAAPTTFAMPVIAAIADWGAGAQGRATDGRGLSAGTLAADLAAIIVLALGLTLVAQAIVGHADIGALFTDAASHGRLPTFPYLIPIGATSYVAFLQLSIVCDGRRAGPARFGRAAGPIAALACLALGVAVYRLATNWDTVPALARQAVGLRATAGPLPALDLVTWLIAVTAWQGMFNLLDGWPLSGVSHTGARLTAANAAVVGLGSATYVVARVILDVSPGELSAAAAMFAAGALVMKALLDGWPFGAAPPARRRAWLLAGALGLAALGDVGLRALALSFGGFTTDAPVQLWLVVCGLNLVGGGVLIAGPICGLGPRETGGRQHVETLSPRLKARGGPVE